MSADTTQKGTQQDGAQQDSNPVGQWFSGTWQKMPWTGGDKDDSANAHASADVKVQAGAKPADGQQSTDGTAGVNEQLAGFWSKTTGLFDNLTPKTNASDSSTTASANASAGADVKVQGGAKTDTQQSTDGTAGVNEQLAGFWTKTTGFFEHLAPKTGDSDSTATANANANGDVKVQASVKPNEPNAGTQQSASADGSAGVNDQLAGFWTKTTGFFEHLAPKTSDSDSTATANGDVKVQASATKPKDDQKVDAQQASSGGVNEQLAGFWSKTTGLFENLAPKTNDSESSSDTNKQASS